METGRGGSVLTYTAAQNFARLAGLEIGIADHHLITSSLVHISSENSKISTIPTIDIKTNGRPCGINPLL